MLKACEVRDDYADEGGCCIRFAESAVVARREGANELNIEFESVSSCRRAPQFDKYADRGHVPPLVRIDHGWWFECMHCGSRLSLDDIDEERSREAMVESPDFSDAVYCNATCLAEWQAERAAKRARFEAFRTRVTTERPDLDWKRFEGGTGGTCYAIFHFPGGKYGGSVRMDDAELSWSIAQGDLDAWNQYEQKRASI